jgi:hypothetical protein
LIYSEQKLLEALHKLPARAVAAFAAACAERLFSAYEKAANQLPAGDTNRSRALLTNVWSWSLGANIALSNADIEYVIALIVAEDEGATLSHAIADDTLAAIAYAARYALTSDPQEAVWAARRAYEATDRFVAGGTSASAYTPEMEAAILASDIVQQELARQQRDLSDLGRVDIPFDRCVLLVRQRAEAESALPLD